MRKHFDPSQKHYRCSVVYDSFYGLPKFGNYYGGIYN